MPRRSTGRPPNARCLSGRRHQRWRPGKLYLRVNAGAAPSKIKAGNCTEPDKACTYEVSELVSNQPAQFIAASPDGNAGDLPDRRRTLRIRLRDQDREPDRQRRQRLARHQQRRPQRLPRLHRSAEREQKQPRRQRPRRRTNLYLHRPQGYHLRRGRWPSVDQLNEAGHKAPAFPRASCRAFASSRISPDGQHAGLHSRGAADGL